MRVLITGGAGFIGSQIAKYHLNSNDEVYCIDNLSTGKRENIQELFANPNFQFEQQDILTYPNLAEIACWADRIYHMAAVVGFIKVLEDPISVITINTEGTERLFHAVENSTRSPQIIVASSSSVYGGNTKVPNRETDLLCFKSSPFSLWPYALSKFTEEMYCNVYVQKKNMRIYIVRLFNTIGPNQTGQYGMVVPRFVQQAIKGEPITVYGDGKQTRSFCDVRDTVKMLDLLASNESAIGEIVNVGNDHETSINELAHLVKRVTGSSSPIIHVPYKEAYGAQWDEVHRRNPCLNKLHSFIDYSHQWTLEKTITYLAEQWA